MSRFFGGSDSDSDSTSSEEEQVQQRNAGNNVFMQSDDEDDVKRVVKSHKDKRFDELKDAIRAIKNHKKINDIAKVLSSFELLGKIYLKAKNIIDKEGIPKFYVKYLVELEDYVKEIWDDKDTKKKLSKVNAKALGALRQKMKKYVRDFENDMADYRENPDVDEDLSMSEGEEDESDEDLDDGDDMDFTKKPENTMGRSQFLKSGTSESEGESDEWSSSGDEDDGSDRDGAGGIRAAGPSIFLKSAASGTAVKDTKRRKGKGSKQVTIKEDNELSAEEETKLPKDKALFGKDAEITNESVLIKVQEILAVRGKKATDRREVINTFKELLNITQRENLSTALIVKILIGLISAIYDSAVAVLVNSMKQEYWKMCTEFLITLMDTLLEHPEINTGMNIPEESENVTDPNLPYQVRGCAITLMERMDDEFTKILQSCDARSPEYIQRLKDENIVTSVIKKTQKLVEKNNFPPSDICKAYLRRIEHMYYKYDTIIAKTTKSECNDDEENKQEIKDDSDDTPNSREEMARLCNYIYKRDQTERIRTRAMLCQTYHHAIHDRWTDARDLMLMSHLQESIQYSDIPTQVLYNRTMVQLGLCAFRHGIIKNAHNCLVELQVTNRVRELLAQGFSQRQSDKTKDQEKLERQRQIPFHMHINTELIECCYLTSAMLLEIPYMAAHEFDNRRRLISKNFHFHLRNSERQTLVGPPESMRDQVIAAAHAMRTGDWKLCSEYVLGIKVWDLFTEPDSVKKMLSKKIREESLRTYLFTYGGVYSSLSLSSLSEMFGMESSDVYRTISKMIMSDELQASWDEPTETLMMHKCEPTKLQNLAIQIADKIYALADTNEKILHERHGYQTNKDWRGEQGRDRRRVQQSQNTDENWSGNKGNQGRSGKGSGQRNKRKHGGK